MEEDQQQAPEIKSTPYQSPMHTYAGSIVMLTNPSDILFRLELDMKNLYYNEETGDLDPIGDPLLNNTGVNHVLALVRSRVNQNTNMSNLEEKEIYFFHLRLADTLIKSLMINKIQFGIENNATRSTIVDLACSYAYIGTKRPYKQGERIFWSKAHQDIRTTVVADREKKGFLSSLNIFGK